METNSAPDSELAKWLLELTSEVNTASAEKRVELLKELKNDIEEQAASESIELFYFYFSLRFSVLPELLVATNIELHEVLDDFFLEEIIEATQRPDQLLCFCKLLFPKMENVGIPALANDRMLLKVQNILTEEVIPTVEMRVKITSSETFGELVSFLEPYIKKAMKLPFAQEEVIIVDENGKRPYGKKYDILQFIKDALQKLSLPPVAISELN